MATSLDVRRSAALDPSTSPEDLAELARDSDVVVRRRVATADRLVSRSIELLANDVDPIVREKIAERSDIPPSIRVTLANDRRWNVRAAAHIDAHDATAPDDAQPAEPLADDPATVFSRARDPERAVRLDLARSSDALDDQVLEILALDEDPLVRHAVAARDRTLPDTVVTSLMSDTEWPVRMAVAGRSDLTEAQRVQLSNDPNEKVRAKTHR